MSLETSSRWGLLPVAIALAVAVVVRLAALTGGRTHHAILRGGVLALALVVTTVRVLGAVTRLEQEPLFGALLIAAFALFLYRRDRRIPSLAGLVSVETAPVALVAGAVVVTSFVAAYLLPVWQWDALGYHLPYVDFALQRGSLSDVPSDVPYLSTYPHVIEHYFIAWRAMLPDDRLVDAAQIPLGFLGVAAIAAMARDLGARKELAVLAGLSWLTLPALFLQLPTNYIDIGTAAVLLAAAAFVLAEPTPANVLGAGVALGLTLGSKPNAPIATTLLFGVLLVRGWRAGRRGSLLLAAAAVLLLGAESYVRNLASHGNPIWPVRMKLGPITLPGLVPMSALLESGCAAPRVHGSFLVRLVRSWTTLDAPPVFDMRYGGLGLVFLAALPAAVFAAWREHRRMAVALVVVALAALASPDPVVPRYILAFPGVVFAVAAGTLDVPRLSGGVRRALVIVAAVIQTVQLVRVYPGLVGEGPPLSAYLGMTEAQRLRAVGADGSPAGFYDALAKLERLDVTAFDTSLELPYLAWAPDLSTRARWIPDPATPADIERILGDPFVRLLIVGEHSPIAAAAEAGGRFVPIHHCKPRVPPKCLLSAPEVRSEELPRSLVDPSSCIVLLHALQ